MIEMPFWMYLALAGFAGIGLWNVLRAAVRAAWDWLQLRAGRRLARRMEMDRDATTKAIWRKFLRHVPSGRIGLCVESGFAPHRWLEWLRPTQTVDLMICPGCVRGELAPRSGMFVLLLPHPGQRIRVPLRETAAALDTEIAAFRAAMEHSGEEAG